MPGVTTAYQTGVHGSRPAASAGCILYSCTTHGLVYRSDGTSWTTFLTLPSGSVSASPSLTLSTSASAGVATTFVATDATLPIFDATAPSTQAFSDAAAVGVAAFAARRDHKHAMPASPGGGSTYGQVYSYPTTFTGDVINGSSTTPFVDTSAFDTKEVLNSRILHLTTLGASKDQRVRVTLGTTKAAAFDVTTAVAFAGNFWGAGFDQYLEVRGSTSADAQLFIARLGATRVTTAAGQDAADFVSMRVGGSSIAAQDANFGWPQPVGETHTLRFVRDGSNVISFTFGRGTAPMALSPFLSNINVPFTATVSGTLARIEYSIHTGSGPGSTAAANAWVDYLASV